jgi:hypothetical protein
MLQWLRPGERDGARIAPSGAGFASRQEIAVTAAALAQYGPTQSVLTNFFILLVIASGMYALAFLLPRAVSVLVKIAIFIDIISYIALDVARQKIGYFLFDTMQMKLIMTQRYPDGIEEYFSRLQIYFIAVLGLAAVTFVRAWRRTGRVSTLLKVLAWFLIASDLLFAMAIILPAWINVMVHI